MEVVDSSQKRVTDLQLLGDFTDSLESVVGTWVGALVWVNQQGQPPVPLLDLG